MELKRKITQNPLLEARAEALKNAESQSLRPLGKLWGMDVFTWVNPSVNELAATIHSFPFPVYLFAPARLIIEFAMVDDETLKLVSWIGQYDKNTTEIDASISSEIVQFSATNSVSETIELMRLYRMDRHIVLFVATGNDWMSKINEFEEFVKTAQQS
jgi:hypothetical protein